MTLFSQSMSRLHAAATKHAGPIIYSFKMCENPHFLLLTDTLQGGDRMMCYGITTTIMIINN